MHGTIMQGDSQWYDDTMTTCRQQHVDYVDRFPKLIHDTL